MKKLLAFLILPLTILAGCAALNEPTPAQLEAATYPTPFKQDKYQAAIKEWAIDNLVDPDSLQIRSVDTTPARKGWIAVCTKYDEFACVNRMFYFGYIFNARINAKNTSGGYTGFQDYAFVIRGDTIAYGVSTDKITNMGFVK